MYKPYIRIAQRIALIRHLIVDRGVITASLTGFAEPGSRHIGGYGKRAARRYLTISIVRVIIRRFRQGYRRHPLYVNLQRAGCMIAVRIHRIGRDHHVNGPRRFVCGDLKNTVCRIRKPGAA